MSETIASVNNDISKIEEGNKIVRNHVIATLVPAVIPVPLLDIALISSIQLKMIHSLCNLYDIKFSKDIGKEAIASLIGGVVPVALTPIAMSLIQVVPVIGQAAGTIGLFTLAGASTYAVGNVFIQHFETGGTLLTFNAEKMKEHFSQEFEKGKQVVTEIKNDRATQSSSSTVK